MQILFKNGRVAKVGDMAKHLTLGHLAEVKEIRHQTALPNALVEHQDNHLVYAADITEWLHVDDAPKPKVKPESTGNGKPEETKADSGKSEPEPKVKA